MKLFIIGVLVFLPLFCMSFITAMIFSPFIPADVRISLSIACMPIYGLLLGAAMGHLFGMREKDRKNAGLEQLMVEIDETGRTR
ncbi:MAG: hypothetical protein Q8R70_02675 [Methanoregula sp.]|nr:hypothetical protein [Methanoregula sp.]